MYTDLDPSNVNASYKTGTGAFVLDTASTIASTTITDLTVTELTVTGDATFDTDTLFVDATNDVVQFGTTGAVPSTFTGVQLYTQTTSTNAVLFESTSASTAGPELFLYHNSSSPANNDVTGKLRFYGNDSGGDAQEYAQIRTIISDVTAAAEDSVMAFYTCDAGTLDERIRINSDGYLLVNATSSSALSEARLYVSDSTTAGVTLFENTATGATGVYSYFYHNSSSPAAGDNVGLLRFYGNDSAGNETEYGRFHVELEDPTNGSEDSSISTYVYSSGTQTNALAIDGSTSQINVASGFELNLPDVDPPTANMMNRNSGVKAYCTVGVGTSTTGSISGDYNCVGTVTVSSWEVTVSWDTNFSSTDYCVVAGIGETGSATEGEYYIVNTDRQTGTASFQAYDDFLQGTYNSTYSLSAVAFGDQ